MSNSFKIYAKTIYADIDVRFIAKLTVALNSTFTILALFCLQQDVALYWESYTEGFQRTVLVKNNYTNPMTIRDMLEMSVPSSPHFQRVQSDNRHMLVEYGTTWGTWCWNDPLPLSGLPSILRAIEFHSLSQLLLRFTFLLSLSVRPILGAFRALAVYNRLATKTSFCSSPIFLLTKNPIILPVVRRVSLLNQSVLLLSPFISFIVLIAGYFITSWHQDLDFHSLMWVPFYSFALLYTLHMILHTTIELMEPERMNTLRVFGRLFLILAFIITAVIVLRTHDEFLERKTCHVMVPTKVAIAEYVCFITIAISSLSEWTDFWYLNIMAEDDGIDLRELDECCSVSSSNA